MSDKIESAREALDRITRWAVDNTEHFSIAMDAIGDETESIRAAFLVGYCGNEADAKPRHCKPSEISCGKYWLICANGQNDVVQSYKTRPDENMATATTRFANLPIGAY